MQTNGRNFFFHFLKEHFFDAQVELFRQSPGKCDSDTFQPKSWSQKLFRSVSQGAREREKEELGGCVRGGGCEGGWMCAGCGLRMCEGGHDEDLHSL